MAPISARGPSKDERRAVFDRARRDADSMLARDGDPAAFCIWAVSHIRARAQRELRHEALDGVMAAMDDDEARRA